jgi:hypothetical protein
MAKNSEGTTTKLVINDEDDWPELSAVDIRVVGEVPDPNGQLRNVKRLTLMFGGLFLLYATYAMKEGHLEMVQSGFDFVKLALAASVSWTFGRRSTSGS